MTIKEYQEIINLTAVYPREIGIMYCTLGLCGEAGEVAEKVKKVFRDNQGIVTEDKRHELKKEIGDVLWYCTALASELGFSLEEILEENYNKLIQRRKTNTLHGSGDNREIKSLTKTN